MFKFRKWLDQKLGVNVYELREKRIVKERGRKPSDILALRDIAFWHVDYEMVFDVVTIRLKDGREIRWLDKYDDLLGILRTELGDIQKNPNQGYLTS
jgi:hypothetical protein